MQLRDTAMLIACCAASLVSFRGTSGGDGYRLRRSWRFDLDAGLWPNGEAPAPHQRLPRPLVADLDGDGAAEVVVCTREPSVKVLSGEALGHRSSLRGTWERPNETRSASLLSSAVRKAKGRMPAAVAAGYLDVADVVGRKMVVVVVTQDWSLLCFDDKLSLLWETSLQDFVPEQFFFREVAISIMPSAVFEGDRGMIVVAGATEHPLSMRGHGKVNTNASKPDAEDEDMTMQDDLLLEQDLRHFSYYAVEGGKGKLRWSHEAGDFENTVMDKELNLSPQHNYKLDVQGNERHTDEVDWRAFRASILGSLPHHWSSRDDTYMTPHKFQRDRRQGARTKAKKARRHHNVKASLLIDPHARASAGGTASLLGKTARPPPGRYAAHPAHGIHNSPDAKLQAGHYRHEPSPAGAGGGASSAKGKKHGPQHNVLVVHRSTGVEVIHLFSGRMVTQVQLAQGTHADLNADGKIDHVYTLAGHDVESTRSAHDRIASDVGKEADADGEANGMQQGCTAVATSGVPIREELWHLSVCHGKKDRAKMTFSGRRGREAFSQDTGNPPLHAVDPVLVPSDDGISGHWNSIVLLSSGRLSCVTPHGHRQWQLSTSAMWSRHAAEVTMDAERSESEHRSVQVPSLTLVDLEADPAQERDPQLVAVGESAIVIVSREGRVRSTIGTAEACVNKPTFGDFDGDGVTDIILSSATGYSGIIVERRGNVGGALFAALVAILLVVLGVVFAMISSDPSAAHGRRRVRSTDD